MRDRGARERLRISGARSGRQNEWTPERASCAARERAPRMTRSSALEALAASAAFETPARAVQTARGTSVLEMVRRDEVDDDGSTGTRDAREALARERAARVSSVRASSSSDDTETATREEEEEETAFEKIRRRRSRATSRDDALPYSEEDARLLRASLMRWVRRLGGVVSSRHARGDLETAFADGVSLCDLVEKMDGAPVLGVFRSPKTEATRESNRRKAVERLLRMRNMSRRFLTTTSGSLDIVGVLEDCRVFMDGLPPRPKKPWDARKPYIPDVDGYGAPDFDGARRRNANETFESAIEARTFEDARAETTSFRVKISSVSIAPSSAPTARPRPRRRQTRTHTMAKSDTLPPSAHELAIDPEDAADHVRWLARRKFWPRDVSAAVADFPTTRTVDVFTDVFHRGVILCDIVERHYRVTLPGVTRRDPSRAAALHNVSVALRELRRDVRVSTCHLWSERAIARGDPSACSCILWDVRARVGSR